MKSLNFFMPQTQLRRKFYEADINRKGEKGFHKLDFAEFCTFYKRLATRRDVGRIMLRFGTVHGQDELDASDPNETFDRVCLSITELQNFLREEQGLRISRDECQRLISEYEPSPDLSSKGQLGIEGFTKLLLGPIGDAFTPQHNTVYQVSLDLSGSRKELDLRGDELYSSQPCGTSASNTAFAQLVFAISLCFPPAHPFPKPLFSPHI